MAGQDSSDDEVSNSPLKEIYCLERRKILTFFVEDSSPFIGLGNGYPLDNFPLFHRVRSVQFDNRYSGYFCQNCLALILSASWTRDSTPVRTCRPESLDDVC